jgi:uncharacterized protein YceK
MKRVFIVLVVMGLAGCAAVESVWYGCNTERWRGWDYQQECVRLHGAA